MVVYGSVSSSLHGTASCAITASYVKVFPYNGNVEITGSIGVLGLPHFSSVPSGIPSGALYTSDEVKGPNNQFVVCINR
jgi:hypothetical protein